MIYNQKFKENLYKKVYSLYHEYTTNIVIKFYSGIPPSQLEVFNLAQSEKINLFYSYSTIYPELGRYVRSPSNLLLSQIESTYDLTDGVILPLKDLDRLISSFSTQPSWMTLYRVLGTGSNEDIGLLIDLATDATISNSISTGLEMTIIANTLKQV